MSSLTASEQVMEAWLEWVDDQFVENWCKNPEAGEALAHQVREKLIEAVADRDEKRVLQFFCHFWPLDSWSHHVWEYWGHLPIEDRCDQLELERIWTELDDLRGEDFPANTCDAKQVLGRAVRQWLRKAVRAADKRRVLEFFMYLALDRFDVLPYFRLCGSD